MRQYIRVTLWAAVLALCGFGQAQANDTVADVQFTPDSIWFNPSVSYAQLELTVGGNGFYWQRKYGAGESASFSTSDAVLADGQYRYELIASPPHDEQDREASREDTEALQALEAAKRANTYRQWGRFEVVQGQLMAPQEPEDRELPVKP